MKFTGQYGIDRVTRDSPLLVSMSDATFLPLLQNWLAGMRRLGLENLLIVALDDETVRYLEEQEIPYLSAITAERTQTLQAKTAAVYYLVDQGFDVLFSDADAIWLKDSIPYLMGEEAGSQDILLSQAFGHPKSIVKLRGFCLCSGYYLIRSNPKTKLFLQYWLQYQVHYPEHCDQSALNAFLHEGVREWNIPEPRHFSFSELHPQKAPNPEMQDFQYLYSDSLITGELQLQDLQVKIGVLPFKEFRRGPAPSAEAPYMVHIGSGGNVDRKVQEIRQQAPEAWFI